MSLRVISIRSVRLVALLWAICVLFSPRVHATPNWVAYHGKTAAQHQVEFDTLAKQGYRMISLSVYGDQTNPLYAAVWVQRGGPKWIAFHGLQAQNYPNYYQHWSAAGYQPAILTATGSGPTAVFAGVYEQTSQVRVAPYALTRQQFDKTADLAQKSNYILKWATVYGTAANPTFAGIWEPNTTNTAWSHNYDSPALMQQVFNAYTKGWVRPELLVTSPDQNTLGIWHDNSYGLYYAEADMTSAQYQDAVNQHYKQGLLPIRVQGAGTGGNIRYTAIFAPNDTPVQRQWTATGKALFNLAAFDTYVKTLMQYYGIRAGQLAIARKGKLIYTRAFTWAEPGYPITQPTSLFRIASMSKPITSIAIHQLLEKPGTLSLNDPVFSILKPTLPPGQLIPDWRVAQIQVWHLLSHAGGWSVSPTNVTKEIYVPGLGFDPMFNDVATVDAFFPLLAPMPPLPVSKQEIAGYMLTQPLQFDPGAYSIYSNFGFSLLGQILEAKNPGWTYTDWVLNSVFQPLGVTRARLGHSLLEQAAPGEARYHPRYPTVGPDVLSIDRPVEPVAYGQFNLENLDSHGAWVMAAADYARILAAFDRRQLNPLFKSPQQTTKTMWSAPVAISPTTLRGWFSLNLSAPGGALPAVQHNGGLPGTSTLGVRRSDGLSFVLFFNQDIPAGSDPSGVIQSDGLHAESHGAALNAIANTIMAWPTTDLFPTVGIPSF